MIINLTTPLEQLLASACPSIKYRTRKEFLHQSSLLPEMKNLQDQILRDQAVKQVMHSQEADGWLGWTFHGYNSMEAGIRLLCEKGMEADHPVMARALESLEKHTDRLERGLGKVGKILEDLGFGGSETIRASLFVHAGNENLPLVREQIEQALEVFKSARQIKSLEDLYRPYKDKFVFRESHCWPSIYHLRLLAMSQSWRTPENRKMITASIQHIVHLSPIPSIQIKYKSQLLSPASFCMDDFTPDMNRLTDAEWMQWFHRTELLARLGVVDQIPELKRQAQTLVDILVEGQGLFTKRLHHPYFKKWGAYTGLMLEKDWRLPQHRISDLTFRSLLILHYAKQDCHSPHGRLNLNFSTPSSHA